ncbi:MAG: avidin/streptavidin family protein [Candidatus Thiodiazotropha sp.]
MTEATMNDNPLTPIGWTNRDCMTIPHVRLQLTRGRITNNGATPWAAPIGLGTPPQTRHFMLNTGTLNTWITASSCSTPACRQHQSFDPDRSSSFHAGDEPPTTVDFGPWGNMGVELGQDICQLDYITCEDANRTTLSDRLSLYLSVCYDGDQFAGLACDGGIAIPAIPCEQPTALLGMLQQQGYIEQAIAAFYFDPLRGEGACLLGAVDPRRFDPASVNILPVVPLTGELDYLWNVALESITIAGQTVTSQSSLVLDTGSSRFKGGASIIKRMLDAITDHGRLPDRVSDPQQLSAYPDIILTLGGQCYSLSPQDYFLPVGTDDWELGVHVLPGLPDELLVVGSVFLDTVYSVFDFVSATAGSRSVSLATPVHPKLSVSGIWENEFGSTLHIGPLAPDGTFQGSYTSHTGATGRYPVVGVADPQPLGNNLAVAFSVTWRSLEGQEDPSWHWVSGFTGLMSLQAGVETLSTSYLLQQNATPETPAWMATAIYPSTFRRKP